MGCGQGGRAFIPPVNQVTGLQRTSLVLFYPSHRPQVFARTKAVHGPSKKQVTFKVRDKYSRIVGIRSERTASQVIFLSKARPLTPSVALRPARPQTRTKAIYERCLVPALSVSPAGHSTANPYSRRMQYRGYHSVLCLAVHPTLDRKG
jgi:hypothetical protein